MLGEDSGTEAATEVGAEVVLGDRAVRLTLARTWAALSTWERFRFMWQLLYTVRRRKEGGGGKGWGESFSLHEETPATFTPPCRPAVFLFFFLTMPVFLSLVVRKSDGTADCFRP